MKKRSILTFVLSLALCAGAAHGKGRDTNGDKLLSLEEFLANRKHPEKARKHFEKADANHDGSLDRSERATLKKHHKKHPQHAGKAKLPKHKNHA